MYVPIEKPHNPMVNAGAILVLSLLLNLSEVDMSLAEKFDWVMNYFKVSLSLQWPWLFFKKKKIIHAIFYFYFYRKTHFFFTSSCTFCLAFIRMLDIALLSFVSFPNRQNIYLFTCVS